MSPDIRIGNRIVARVPDETGIYQTVSGKSLYVNVDGIDASAKRQLIIVEADEIGGRREIGLTHEGLGTSYDKKKGDGKSPTISVSLLNRPIRISYTDKEWSADGRRPYTTKRTYENPRWMKGHGRR